MCLKDPSGSSNNESILNYFVDLYLYSSSDLEDQESKNYTSWKVGIQIHDISQTAESSKYEEFKVSVTWLNFVEVRRLNRIQFCVAKLA